MAKDIVKEIQKEVREIAETVDEDNEFDEFVSESVEPIVKEEKVADVKEEITETDKEEDVPETDTDDEFNVSDDVVESAIKAGMSYSDVLKLNDEELIGRMIGVAASKDGGKKTEATEEEVPSDLSFLDIEDIFEVEDPSAVFKSIKETFLGLRDEISALKTQRQKDVLIDGTSEMMSKLKPDEQEKVREKMEVLSQGYRQRGINTNPSDIFEEATKLALGDTLSKDAINKLTSRSKKTIQRVPGKKGVKVRRALTEEEAHDKVLAKMEKKMDGWSK